MGNVNKMDYITIIIVCVVGTIVIIGSATFLRWIDKKINRSQTGQSNNDNEQDREDKK